MPRSISIHVRCLVALVLLSVVSGACTSGTASKTMTSGTESAFVTTRLSESAAQEPASALLSHRSPAEGVPCPSPLRVGVLLDKSRSTRENVVPQMTEDELDDLILLVDTCAGGEIAVGTLCNISGDKPFARLFVPARTPGPREEATVRSQDAFSDLRRAEAEAVVTARRHLAEAREAETRTARIARFRQDARGLVLAPVSCTRTDVVSGANRLLTYLGEPLPGDAAVMPVRVGAFVTDGADTVGRQRLRYDADLAAAYLLVGGSPDAGALAPLNPSRFESVGAALRWIRSAATAR